MPLTLYFEKYLTQKKDFRARKIFKRYSKLLENKVLSLGGLAYIILYTSKIVPFAVVRVRVVSPETTHFVKRRYGFDIVRQALKKII